MDRFISCFLLVSMFAFAACGDDSGSSEPPPSAPEFDEEAFSIVCADTTSDDRFDGRFVSMLSVSVSDVDFDLVRVTAVVSGTGVELEWTKANEDGTSTGESLGEDTTAINLDLSENEMEKTAHVWSRADGSTPLRCTSGAAVVFRAMDAMGNVTVEEKTLP